LVDRHQNLFVFFFFLPNNLVELNGLQHYKHVSFFNTTFEIQQERDAEKRRVLDELGFAYVDIPAHLWKGSLVEIAKTIEEKYPGKFPTMQYSHSDAIRVAALKEDLETTRTTLLNDGDESAGSSSSFVMLPKAKTNAVSNFPTKTFSQYWMQEKYDGIRAYYDPIKRKLFSKQNLEINAPVEWLDKFKNVTRFLDGELWLGRGKYEDLQSALKNSDWKLNDNSVKFVVFDIIDFDLQFEDRMISLLQLPFPTEDVALKAHTVKCQSGEHIIIYLKQLTSEGGEGIVLRKGSSYYTSGYSSEMFKVKVCNVLNIKKRVEKLTRCNILFQITAIL